MTNRELFNRMLNDRPDPRRAYNLLACLAGADHLTNADAPAVDQAGKANVEKLTARLNACRNPRKIYNALMTAAPAIRPIIEGRRRDPAAAADVAAAAINAMEKGCADQ